MTIDLFQQIISDAFCAFSVLPTLGGSIYITSLYTLIGNEFKVAVLAILIGAFSSFVLNYFLGYFIMRGIRRMLKPKVIEKIDKDINKITASIVFISSICAILNTYYTSQIIILGGLMNANKKVIIPLCLLLVSILISYQIISIPK